MARQVGLTWAGLLPNVIEEVSRSISVIHYAVLVFQKSSHHADLSGIFGQRLQVLSVEEDSDTFKLLEAWLFYGL